MLRNSGRSQVVGGDDDLMDVDIRALNKKDLSVYEKAVARRKRELEKELEEVEAMEDKLRRQEEEEERREADATAALQKPPKTK